jgi:predicted RNA-binding Zn-ribbon protein involved in translation (DUF1610 family)
MIAQTERLSSKNSSKKTEKWPKDSNYAKSIGYCLSCKSQLSFCGIPFSTKLECPKCGAINVYEESQQPKRLLTAA